MRRLLLGATIAALAITAPAARAATVQTSDTSHPWQQWADTAQVPTWTGTLPLTTSASGYFDCGGWGQAAGCTSLDPAVDQTTGQIIPNQFSSITTEIALGDPTDYEHGYFLHELGQVFWAVYMTPADEDQFMQIVGLAGDHTDWSNAYTTVINGVTIHFPPFEWFAEGYRLCALFGVNQPASANTFSDFGYPGLQASFAHQQRQVCQLIDAIGVREGIATPAQASPVNKPGPKSKPRRHMKLTPRQRQQHRIMLGWGRRRIW